MTKLIITPDKEQALTQQEGDIFLFQTVDGGDIRVFDGLIGMTQGLETAVFLSLFGGNQLDDGYTDNEHIYWGNLTEINPSRHYRSETQYLLETLPRTQANLLKIEDAGMTDLQWFITEKIASEVQVQAQLSKINEVNIGVSLSAQGQEQNFSFTEYWRAVI